MLDSMVLTAIELFQSVESLTVSFHTITKYFNLTVKRKTLQITTYL